MEGVYGGRGKDEVRRGASVELPRWFRLDGNDQT
jgi:hypothetical protein